MKVGGVACTADVLNYYVCAVLMLAGGKCGLVVQGRGAASGPMDSSCEPGRDSSVLRENELVAGSRSTMEWTWSCWRRMASVNSKAGRRSQRRTALGQFPRGDQLGTRYHRAGGVALHMRLRAFRGGQSRHHRRTAPAVRADIHGQRGERKYEHNYFVIGDSPGTYTLT